MTTKTTAQKKASCSNCASSIVPVCVFVSLLSAILVTLVFSFLFSIYVQAQKLSSDNTYEYAFASEINAGNTDNYGILKLSASGVISMSQNGKSGFLIVSASGDSAAESFKQKIYGSCDLDSIDDIYSFEVSKSKTKDENSVLNWLDNSDADAALVYIKNGAIYDRLDDINSESDISTFLGRYK